LNEFRMMEIRLDPSTGTVLSERTIDDSVNVEFSVVPVQGEFTRFGYTAIQDPTTPGEGTFSGFCVWDMANGRLHKTYSYNKDEVGGEPMLLTAEDGTVYVGVYLHNLLNDVSYFCLYNGTTTDLVARWKLPYRVPYGFHGTWVSEKEMLAHFAYHEQQEMASN
jgi:9-cis-epoxycarotenoid dioxygenase